MATKKSAVKKTVKKAGKVTNARKTAVKPVKKTVKAAAKPKVAAKAVAKKVTAGKAPGKMVRPSPKPVRLAKAKAKINKPSGKSSRPSPRSARPAASKPSRTAQKTAPKLKKAAIGKVSTKPTKARVPKVAAKVASKVAAANSVKVTKAKLAPGKPAAARRAAPARSGRARPEERKALPHKEPARPAMSLNDYFDVNASPYPTLPPSRREVLPVAVEWKEKMRPGELYQAFKRFFEANEIGNRLTGPLREQAAAIVEFEGDPQIYKVVKVRGRTIFEQGRPASAEVYVKLSRHSVEALLAPNATKPVEYVERFCALLAEADPVMRIEFKLLCTQGEAIRKGYLGVVASGGKRLAETLIPMGYSMPQDFIRQLK